MRGVPDISLNAFGYLGYWQSGWYGFLGTSLGAPSWAGIYADMDQMARAKAGTGLGFVAPALYSVAGQKASPFHDITQGTNGQWNAGPGWDPVTGLGTPDVAALAQDLVNYLSQGGATAPGPFISVVTPSAADGSNGWLGVSDPLVAASNPAMNVPLTDAIVTGSTTTISGSGFGNVQGAVYLVSNDGSIDTSLTISSWTPNTITLDTTGAIAAPPGIYNLVVQVPGLSQPLVTGVALESGIALGNLSFTGTDTVSGPLSVDNYNVTQAVYANGEISAIVTALMSLLGGGGTPFAMPAAIFIPGLSTPQQPILSSSSPSNFTQTGDQMLVTLTSPSAELLYVTLNPVNVNPVPLYGTDMYGYPEYMVPVGEPLAVIDPTAEAVGVVVQDATNPALVAPAQAEVNFLPGTPVAMGVTPLGDSSTGTTVQTATYDPGQAVPIALQILDPNSNVVPNAPTSWTVQLQSATGASSVGAAVYYSTDVGNTWTQAQPITVGSATYGIPVQGSVWIAMPDPNLGDAFTATVNALGSPAPAGPIPWPALGPAPVQIVVVPQSQVVLTPQAPAQLGSLNQVGVSVYDQTGKPVGAATDRISLAVQGSGVTIYDQNQDPLVPSPNGTYPLTLQNGQTTFYYSSDTAGPVQFTAYDNFVYLPPATLQQTILPGTATSLGVSVFSSASVGAKNFGENPEQVVVVGAFDQYGNLATGFGDQVGLQVSGGSGIQVRDASGTLITPLGGTYAEMAQKGQAVFLVSSTSPGTLAYLAQDLGGAGAQSGEASGSILSPYAASLNLSAGGSVVANTGIWSGIPQKVTVTAQDALGNLVTSNGDTVVLAVYGPKGATITVTDAQGNALSPDTQGDYELPLVGGSATYLVTSSLSGTISYSAMDLSVPSVQSTNGQFSISLYPVSLDPVPLKITGSNGSSVSTSGGSIQLQRGVSYDIALSFANNDATMPVTPIIEVTAPDGSIAFLQGSQVGVQGGQESIQVSGFTPSQSGGYTIKVFTWNHWLEQGGVPIGMPYQLTVQAN